MLSTDVDKPCDVVDNTNTEIKYVYYDVFDAIDND